MRHAIATEIQAFQDGTTSVVLDAERLVGREVAMAPLEATFATSQRRFRDDGISRCLR
jgi:hypothetical protein